MAQHKYSLWVCPPPGTQPHSEIDALIAKFSKSLDAPRFPPHATLFSPIKAATDEQAIQQVQAYISQLHEQSNGIAGIPVGVLGLATGKKFYQCVLLEVGTTGSQYDEAVIRSANAAARKNWTAEAQPEFYPHVSLVYGEYTPERLASIASKVRDELPSQVHSLSYVATEIRIVETVGPCEQWRDIGAISISTGKHVD
ncbi:hypothetical protein GGI12_003672 [Dipsacomyces acuminosporus]|nr:hypothetical protein GGI12_003672 [Dipsacomyces acuminosporus]